MRLASSIALVCAVHVAWAGDPVRMWIPTCRHEASPRSPKPERQVSVCLSYVADSCQKHKTIRVAGTISDDLLKTLVDTLASELTHVSSIEYQDNAAYVFMQKSYDWRFYVLEDNRWLFHSKPCGVPVE